MRAAGGDAVIYLNAAATSHDRPPEVGRAMLRALEGAGSYGRGAHAAELDAARIVEGAREAMARLLGFAHPERICFMHNATAALNCALAGLVRPGDRLVATDWDHNSVLRPLERLSRERGAEVSFIPADRTGTLDLAAAERLIVPGTRLVAITHASNLTGDVAPVAKLVALARAAGALTVLDAAQTAGCLPFSMEELGVDVLCFTGHKALMGPPGTGGIAVRPGVDVAPFAVGGTGVDSANPRQPDAYPEHLEAGTLNVTGIAGLAAGVAWLLERGVDAVAARERALAERLRAGARDIGGITLYGSGAADGAGIVALNLAGWASSELADALGYEFDIAVRAGLHCAPRMHRALGTFDTGAARLSLSAFTTVDDVDAALGALAELAGAR